MYFYKNFVIALKQSHHLQEHMRLLLLISTTFVASVFPAWFGYYIFLFSSATQSCIQL